MSLPTSADYPFEQVPDTELSPAAKRILAQLRDDLLAAKFPPQTGT